MHSSVDQRHNGATATLPSLADMFSEIEQGPSIFRPSAFWQAQNRRNVEDLERAGFDEFKRTVNANYFQWLTWEPWSDQFTQVWGALSPLRALDVARARVVEELPIPSSTHIRARLKGRLHAFYVAALWQYVRARDRGGLLDRLQEPPLGHPVAVRYGKGLITEDLCNSALEMITLLEALPHGRPPPGGIMELGSGYGRLAWAFLEAFPDSRYVLVDVPPALAVAQEYLGALFSQRRIHRFCHFDDAAQVLPSIRAADLVFLTPNQLELIPPLEVGLFVNISSLHEMRTEQIERYLGLVATQRPRFFYSKQWQTSINVEDRLVIRQDDYPIPPEWRVVFERQHPIQTKFFEALYELPE